MVVSTFPSCGKLTFPQHLEIAPHIWWLLALLRCSSVSSAPWHSRCLQWESASLLAVSHRLSASCSPAQHRRNGAERKGLLTQILWLASPGPVSMQGLAVPRSLLAQRSVLQDAACATASASPLPPRDSMGVSPLALWSGLRRQFSVALEVSACAM